MKNVVEKLKEYSARIALKERFVDGFDVTADIFTSSETKRLITHLNAYDQNIALKRLLSEKYKNHSEQTHLDFWIINAWGGIASFKPNERNIDKIVRFKKQLPKQHLTLDCFSTISSLSKIASFMQPEDFVIYDSRVIYTLNWLILTCENHNGLKQKYFPMPSGRNKIIADFDMNTIINVAHMDAYATKTEMFIAPQEAYFEFCKLVKTTSVKIFGESAKPYQLEMLLFTLADKEIFVDLKQRLDLNFKDDY